MEKRKLSALPRPEATAEMVEMADRLDGMEHIVTAELVDDNKILLLNFYEVSKLKKGKTEAAFRTFLSSDDYITQDLSQSKVKWLTAAFDNMQGFRLWEYKWDQKTWKSEHIPKQLQHSEISPKLKAKLFDGCASCKAHLRKSEMITLLARSKRGEQPKQFGFMCRDCFKEFCKGLGLDIPELIGLAESVTIGPGDEDE